MIGYVKCFDSNKTMSFKVSDKKLLKNYTKIWGGVSSLICKEFGSEFVYGDGDKYIKTKIKLYGVIRSILIFRAKKYQKKMHHTNVCH